MSSALVVPVVRVENVRPHPNADKLDVCDVLGYQMCVPRGTYKSGDLGVYVPADTLIPPEWGEKWSVSAYLKGPEKNRVGRVRLRGEPSFGLIVDMKWLGDKAAAAQVGDNVADVFGCVKYEPPPRLGCADAAAHDADIDPFFPRYTDVQNGRIFTSVFVEGEPVVATEKIHGRNNRVGFVRETAVAGSRTTRKKQPEGGLETNLDWFPLTLPSVVSLLQSARENGANHVILFGEVFGSSVQSLGYGVPKGKLGYRAFDLLVDGRYVDPAVFAKTCADHGVVTAPVLYDGPYSLAAVKKVADGRSTLDGADHIREGVVVRPALERTDTKIGRVILKYIGTEYELSKHKEADSTDV